MGLPPAAAPAPLPGARAKLFLDYRRLVRPEAVEATLTGTAWTNPEDFFFRSVHLGVECWAFALLRLLGSAADGEAPWPVATARIGQVRGAAGWQAGCGREGETFRADT